MHPNHGWISVQSLSADGKGARLRRLPEIGIRVDNVADKMPRIVENALLIYTDGSLYTKGRRGGYSMVFVHVDDMGADHLQHEHSPPGTRGTTNNRMELQACIEGLKMAPEIVCFSTVNRVVIRTDSRYVTGNYLSALSTWPSKKWRDRDGRPIDNTDLWKDFGRAYRNLRAEKRVDLEWVKGHGKGVAKDQYNVRADKLAKESAKSPLSRQVYRSSVRRKIAPTQTRRGSVDISGQRMIIYIVETQWMPAQKTWKYRYQVATKDSPDYHCADWIYSDAQMRDGHYYEVQVNDNMAYPQVSDVIREVEKQEVAN